MAEGGLDARCRAILAAPSRAALQAAAFLIEDLEEHRGGTIVLEVDGESALRAANLGDLARSAGHEDLARGDDLNLRPRRRGIALSVLQP